MGEPNTAHYGNIPGPRKEIPRIIDLSAVAIGQDIVFHTRSGLYRFRKFDDTKFGAHCWVSLENSRLEAGERYRLNYATAKDGSFIFTFANSSQKNPLPSPEIISVEIESVPTTREQPAVTYEQAYGFSTAQIGDTIVLHTREREYIFEVLRPMNSEKKLTVRTPGSQVGVKLLINQDGSIVIHRPTGDETIKLQGTPRITKAEQRN